MNASDLQREYFALLEDFFVAATGEPPSVVSAPESIKQLMLDRLRYDHDSFAREINASADELAEFYRAHSNTLFDAAKSIGGVKLVLGGGSGFGQTQQAAVRKMLLYCDSVLIPDPVARFFEADRFDQAIHLQMAQEAYQLLQLRPLVSADFATPPVLVFPSLERVLEDEDKTTQVGIERLTVAVVNASCGADLASLADVFSYTRSHEREFLAGAAQTGLLIAPGAQVADAADPRRMIEEYVQGLKGRRDPKKNTSRGSRRSPAASLVRSCSRSGCPGNSIC
jgi:hypothetical protein